MDHGTVLLEQTLSPEQSLTNFFSSSVRPDKYKPIMRKFTTTIEKTSNYRKPRFKKFTTLNKKHKMQPCLT